MIKWREGVFEAEAAMFDVFIIIWRDGGLIEFIIVWRDDGLLEFIIIRRDGLIEFIIIWRELFIAEDVGDIEQLG